MPGSPTTGVKTPPGYRGETLLQSCPYRHVGKSTWSGDTVTAFIRRRVWTHDIHTKGPFSANRAAERIPLKYMGPPAAANPLAVAARIWPPHKNSDITPVLLY